MRAGERELALTIAERLRAMVDGLPVQLVFKASFDKANRTSVDAYRGPGLDVGLADSGQSAVARWACR